MWRSNYLGTFQGRSICFLKDLSLCILNRTTRLCIVHPIIARIKQGCSWRNKLIGATVVLIQSAHIIQIISTLKLIPQVPWNGPRRCVCIHLECKSTNSLFALAGPEAIFMRRSFHSLRFSLVFGSSLIRNRAFVTLCLLPYITALKESFYV